MYDAASKNHIPQMTKKKAGTFSSLAFFSALGICVSSEPKYGRNMQCNVPKAQAVLANG